MGKFQWAGLIISSIIGAVGIWYFYEENRRAEEKHSIAMKVQEFFYEQAVTQSMERHFHESD